MEAWRDFKDGEWKKSINVSDFIKRNYTEYTGDESFLEGPTENTKKIMGYFKWNVKNRKRKGYL